MAEFFKKNRFYPQHFFLKCTGGCELEFTADRICREAVQLSPASFNGDKPYFRFILRYCPPYEQDRFRELKRLQEVARSHTRFKDEYRGYIVIDLSEWKNHLDEELFADVTMSFLSDMSACWKYLFVMFGHEPTDREAAVFNKYLKIKEQDALSSADDVWEAFFTSLRGNNGVRFSPRAAKMFRRFIPEAVMKVRETIVSIENDIISFFGDQAVIKREMLTEYLLDPDSVCAGLLAEKSREELRHLEKEETRF